MIFNNPYTNQSNGNVPLQNDSMINKYNSYVDTPLSNDIILHCQGFYFKVNQNIGITNSKLLKTWSTNVDGRGFFVELSDYKKEGIEIVLQLFKNNDIHVPQELILDVYRILVKLECYVLEKNFHVYINQSILMRTGNNNNNLSCLSNDQLNIKNYDVKKDDISLKQLKELTFEIKAMQKNLDNLIVKKKPETKNQKKSLKDLPDVGMSDKVINVKLISGNKILNFKDYKEIFDLLDFYKSKTSFDQSIKSLSEYNNLKLILDGEIYDIKCLMDLKNVAKYIKRIYNKYEKRPIFNNTNSTKTKPVPPYNLNIKYSDKKNQNKLLFNNKYTSKSFKKENYPNKNEKPVSITIKPLNIIQKEIFNEQSESGYRFNQSNTSNNGVFFEKSKFPVNNENKDKKNVEFNPSYYAFSTEISTSSDTTIKTSTYSNEKT